MQILISVIAFIVALGILITFHEFGHFYVARKLGVKVLRFSIGFGKPLWRRTSRAGCEFVIAAIPLGGYVKMLDEREAPVPEHDLPFAFNRKPLWVRTCIVLAGPVFNFIFAVFAYWLMFMIGIKGMAPLIGEVAPQSIAANHDLKTGMEIVEVENEPTATWQEVMNQMLTTLGEDRMRLTVKDKQGQTEAVDLNIQKMSLDNKNPNLLKSLGITPYTPKLPSVIGKIIEGSPADAAQLKPKDKILSVGEQSVQYWHEFVDEVQKYPNESITLSLLRGNERLSIDVVPQAVMNDRQSKGYLGVVIDTSLVPKNLVRTQRYGFFTGFVKGCEKTWDYISLTCQLLIKMITGQISLNTISGPITIAEGAGATAQIGLAYFLGFMGLISVSLGVINLLPIPVLDGGHLLFYLIEAIKGSPPSETFMRVSYQTGFFVLILLMTLAFYNDIVRLAQ